MISRPIRIAALIAIVAVASWLRVWNLGQGLPGILHPDEGPVLDAVKRIMLSGHPNPRFFIYPSLQIYLTGGAGAAAYPFVAWAGRATSWVQFWFDETLVALVGRGLVALFGVGTVLLAYGLARQLLSPAAGLAAAAFLAVSPYHALDTRYTNVDVPMTFWATAAVWCAVAYAQRARRWTLWLGAALVGVAAATKYLGALFLLPVAVAMFVRPGGGTWPRRALLALGLAATTLAVFSLGAPFTWADYASFAATMMREGRYGFQPQFGWDLAPRGVVYHRYAYELLASLPFCLGFGVHALGLAGLAAVWRRCGRAGAVFLVGLGAYFALVGSFEHIFPRYLVPLLPLACVSAGVAVATAMRGARWLRVGACAVAVVGVLHAGGMAATMAAGLSPDVGHQAKRWLEDHLPTGSTVAASYLQQMIPLRGDRFRLVRLEPEAAWLARETPECVVVDGWTLMSLERLGAAGARKLGFFRALDRPESGYRLAATFDPRYFTEGLYGRLDPQFRNQFESACLRVYVRVGFGTGRPGLGGETPQPTRRQDGGATAPPAARWGCLRR